MRAKALCAITYKANNATAETHLISHAGNKCCGDGAMRYWTSESPFFTPHKVDVTGQWRKKRMRRLKRKRRKMRQRSK